ncbi:winged helix-turn-helix domain-containing protein [Pseudoduganella sp. SL102]|uniref:winged helix-turn-helix domain-containing protein n=1 Tax=Pseudoduganella sp. SL102 TaxID=2995154 RepID=UPI00248C19E9|nr:winged helix-turn-helix domain-containing protein [Pseudoduganella sp. SL102]WBS02153.1 winged helix-turn-helix domain-containing protein [Pseudoduganella sp. SL102]
MASLNPLLSGAERPARSTLLQVGAFELWPAARRLRLRGKPVPLTARAFDVLAALALHHPGMASKRALLAAAWPGLVVEENNLQVQVSLLRKLLGSNAITTVPGHGYRLNLPVSGGHGVAVEELPPPAAPLLGRDRDLADLGDMLRQHRLASLLGAVASARVRWRGMPPPAPRRPPGLPLSGPTWPSAPGPSTCWKPSRARRVPTIPRPFRWRATSRSGPACWCWIMPTAWPATWPGSSPRCWPMRHRCGCWSPPRCGCTCRKSRSTG